MASRTQDRKIFLEGLQPTAIFRGFLIQICECVGPTPFLAAAASNLSLWMRQVLLRLVSALRIFQKKWQDAQYPLPA
jgi:hypothetical protein